ncbi:MAG: hypothetical protein EAX95_05425 [Candidatus Thorarchaeota archaeon]|nr:hypothetical protein [Candidatus Thorarchaeota archaeon]
MEVVFVRRGGLVMPRRRAIVTLAFLCVILMLGGVLLGDPVAFQLGVHGHQNNEAPFVSSYTTHVPIVITDDTELELASVGGNGDPGNPFLLEGWNITTDATDGISVSGTTKHFKISNCWIKAEGHNGVEVFNVNPGTAEIHQVISVDAAIGCYLTNAGETVISDSIFTGCEQGIYARTSDKATIENCTCLDNKYLAIQVPLSDDVQVINNTCIRTNYQNIYGIGSDMGVGISFVDSVSATAYDNILEDNGWCGIRVDNSGAEIENNRVSRSRVYGIEIIDSPGIVCFNNTVTDTESIGINVLTSVGCIITNNTLLRNNYHGINVVSDSCVVENNIFIDDGLRLAASSIPAYSLFVVSNNYVNGKPFGFILSETDTAHSANYGQLLMVDCTRVTVTSLDCSRTTEGAVLESCTECVISNSVFDGCHAEGIYVTNSPSTTLHNIDATQCGTDGITIWNSDFTIVRLSNISNNSGAGAKITNSEDCVVANCTIVGNNEGIDYQSVTDITMANCTYAYNTQKSLTISSSMNFIVHNNTFANSGIYFSTSNVNTMLTIASRIRNNIVNGKPLSILTNLDSVEVTGEHGQLILINCTGVNVTSHTISNTAIGIHVSFSPQVRITDCVTNNTGSFGIRVDYSPDCVVTGVRCDNSEGTGLVGSQSERALIVDSSFTGNNIGISMTCFLGTIRQCTIAQSLAQGIWLFSTNSVVESTNSCSNGESGITVSLAGSYVLFNNTFSFNGAKGIEIFAMQPGTIISNLCEGNVEDGVFATNAPNLDVTSNTVVNNGGSGIYLHGCEDPIVDGNFIYGNSYCGLVVEGSDTISITENVFYSNEVYGVYLAYSENSLVHHCVFVDNEGKYGQACDNGSTTNKWYDSYTSEGNYWSDSPGYGIYVIDGDSHLLDFYVLATSDLDGDELEDAWEVRNGLSPFTEDSDSDSIPDAYEVANGLDPTTDDAAGDADGDTLTNLEEYQMGLLAGNNDTDGDAMPDNYEVTNGLNPLFNDAAGDLDADGLNNLNEMLAGTSPISPDSDLDQMPDGWEHYYGLNPLLDDADGDLDGDGLTNYEEYLLGLNPASADSDGDSLPDLWEIENHMNPIIDDSGWDADGDGVTNLEEYENGTNPLIPDATTTTTTTTTTITIAQLDLVPFLTLVVGFVSGAFVLYVLFNKEIIKVGKRAE